MGLYLLPTQRFSVGQELATFITSCRILHKSWEEICNVCKNNVDFSLKDGEDVAYVTFPSFSTEDFIVTDSKYGECDIQGTILSPCVKGDYGKPALLHKRAFNRFQRVLDSPDFRSKMHGLRAQAIIFAGHSMGGAVATLATLWFLHEKARRRSYFCITFGSPLVGNSVLGEAIGREDWTGNFCHVVSKYDIVPRMLLAPFESIAKPLNAIMPRWGNEMGIDFDIVTHFSISDACQTLCEKVLECTSAIANNCEGESALTSPYRPFGTYMFCSNQGAACIDDSEAVLNMLHYTMQGVPSDQLAGKCFSDHTDYGHWLEAITENLLNTMSITNSPAYSFEMGIALEMKAMGVGDQDNNYASLALKNARKMKNNQAMKIEEINYSLSRSQSCMAELEWYKVRCKEGCGYYDSFKRSGARTEIGVNMARKLLETFWKGIVEMEEKHVLPSDFRFRNKWINASTVYRRLVEPLDIAYYYLTRTDNKSYLSERPKHYNVLEKWIKEKGLTRTGRDKNARTKFASVSMDSCVWAHLEEAYEALTNNPQRQGQNQDMPPSLQKNREFEDYIWGMIEDKSISAEIFLEGSSFMIWWKHYSHLQLHSREWTSRSRLFQFMANESWKS